MNKSAKYTVELANQRLRDKGIDFIEVKEINGSDITLYDLSYGQYRGDIKSLSPSTSVPLHKRRRLQLKKQAAIKKYVGKVFNGCHVASVLYGPEYGYKNRSFYLRIKQPCGHEAITTLSILVRHRKNPECASCQATVHGERSKIDGVLKKRSATYNAWVSNKDKLPLEYHDFTTFFSVLGEKPNKKAKLGIFEGRPFWNMSGYVAEEEELNQIALAIRQAFRHFDKYKECLESARVETNTSTKYRCALCKNLYSLEEIQVDHIDPIQPLDGSPLTKETLIDRVVTSKIQVLDRKCHSRKSQEENKIRRLNKKETKRCQKR